jgi:hypothetical protein
MFKQNGILSGYSGRMLQMGRSEKLKLDNWSEGAYKLLHATSVGILFPVENCHGGENTLSRYLRDIGMC